MIRRIILTLDNADNTLNEGCGYYMYGCLSEMMDSDYAQKLHSLELNPISQYIKPDKTSKTAIWTISLLGEEVCGELDFLLEKDNYHIKAVNADIKVIKREVEEIASAEAVIKNASRLPDSHSDVINFNTAASFKSEKKYVIFPDCRLICRSIAKKWSAYAPFMPVDDEDALDMLSSGLRIVRYDLKSRYYPLKDAKIHGFSGSITLKHRLSAPMMELWKLLMYFANFSGVGIKTALGMGAVRIEMGEKVASGFSF